MIGLILITLLAAILFSRAFSQDKDRELLPGSAPFREFLEEMGQPDDGPRQRFPRERGLPGQGADFFPHGKEYPFPGEREFLNARQAFSPVIVSASDSVQEAWAARYNGPGNFIDRANALAVDAAGNVYVTGYSIGSGTAGDYATLKYNSAGVEQWVARYNGPGNSGDGAIALAVDAAGNVYVTGASDGSGTAGDYATLKYNSAGVEQWAAHYNGPENSDDAATALVVDAAGNVYVTGYSLGSGTATDYATLKYNSAGVEQWVARYNGPGNLSESAYALAVDAAGNVYVTGYSLGSGTAADYATLKYNSAGVEQWAVRYNGPGNSNDWAYALAVDAAGNVYVTGESVGSGTAADYATLKYNSAGVEQWAARYNGPGNSGDVATALAVDAAGNVYVTGESVGSGTATDYATLKYNSAGVEQWAARYNGPGNSDDVVTALAVDAAGNVYVTGHSYVSVAYADYATLKYNSAGVEQWAVRYNGPGNGDDWAYALAVDAAGNVYVTGLSEGGAGTSWDYATLKYIQIPTGVGEIPLGIPHSYLLEQNYPNPFNPSTTIRFALPRASVVSLEVFNIAGQRVATLVSGKTAAGEYEIRWQPENLPSGVYIYRLTANSTVAGEAGQFTESRKLVFIK